MTREVEEEPANEKLETLLLPDQETLKGEVGEYSERCALIG